MISTSCTHCTSLVGCVLVCSCVILCLDAKSGGVSISLGPRILGQCFLPFTNQQISSVVGILKNPKQFGLTRRNKGKHAEQYTTAPEICGLRASGGVICRYTGGWMAITFNHGSQPDRTSLAALVVPRNMEFQP